MLVIRSDANRGKQTAFVDSPGDRLSSAQLSSMPHTHHSHSNRDSFSRYNCLDIAFCVRRMQIDFHSLNTHSIRNRKIASAQKKRRLSQLNVDMEIDCVSLRCRQVKCCVQTYDRMREAI